MGPQKDQAAAPQSQKGGRDLSHEKTKALKRGPARGRPAPEGDMVGGADGEDDGLPAALFAPQIRLLGDIDKALVESFQDQLKRIGETVDPVVIELTTLGGDAELSRRLALEVRLARRRTDRRLIFLGKTAVYSAGVTVMAAFPRKDRYITRDTVLLIHGRRMDKPVHFTGPLKAQAQVAREILAQIEVGLALEREGFAELVEGADVGLDEVVERAANNWYVPAEEALRRGLVAALV
ncbi:peptidase S14 [Caulobacter sp. 17J80-11]|uniref:peptidase S14 n=1 Tax=Caulobacter sp. 17J80-11 TaxID=2763502 RepID=UPI001653728F|nr:peptidase S14 [Caulobacter sp. 17J80-11]MBC6982119.1 peptidase S14 [Caulobacter sp. 17J80-11]